jgi:Xaa-Pro dipeptidase
MADLKYTPKLIFGASSVSEGVGVNVPRMREERAAKVKKQMKKQGIAALLVGGEPNVRYLTGFTFREYVPGMSYVLFFADDEPVVFAPAGSYNQVPDLIPWIKNWRIARCWLLQTCGTEAAKAESEIFAKDILQELKERGLAKEKLGLILQDNLAKEALEKKKINVVDASQLLLDASKIKTEDEINCLRIVATICNVGFQRAREIIRPGMLDNSVATSIMSALAEAGSENPRATVFSGPNTFERCITSFPRRLEHGDIMYINTCGNSYMGYHSCIYRTFMLGRKPNSKEKGWYDAVKERVDAAIDATRVGNTTADAAKAFASASKWGLKDEAEVLTIEFGHGIGLASLHSPSVHYNLPVINRLWSLKYPQPFEEGMVIAYEIADGEHRVGGARLENMVVVTKNGPEVMDHYPREEIIVL